MRKIATLGIVIVITVIAAQAASAQWVKGHKAPQHQPSGGFAKAL
jgi:hypothetical protein